MQSPRKGVCHFIHIARLSASAGYDERRSRLVYQNGVDLVDNGKIEFSLHLVLFADNHVVTQKIKTEFVVGAIGDICTVCRPFIFNLHLRNDYSHAEPQKLVEFAHPIGVTGGEIIVYRNDVNALSRKCVEIGRKRSHQSFTFARCHFGNTSLVKRYTAEKLNVKVAHAQNSRRRFSDRGVCLGQNRLELFAVGYPLFKFFRFGLKLLVGKLSVAVRQKLDFICGFLKFFDVSVIFAFK